MAKDMYADLEKIEARGKRKKGKSKGLFSSFGKKDEPEPESDAEGQPEQEVPEEESGNEPAEAPEPTPQETKPAPVPQSKPEPVKPAEREAKPPTHVQSQPVQPPKQPQPVKVQPKHPSGWQPLTGGKLHRAEEELVEYKKWLNKGYKSGMLTKEQCVDMVRKKEIELGLRPPE